MSNDSTISHRCYETRKDVREDGVFFTDQFYIASAADLAPYELPFRTPVPISEPTGGGLYIPESEWANPLSQPYVISTSRKSFTPSNDPPWVLTVVSGTRNYDIYVGFGGMSLAEYNLVSYKSVPLILQLDWYGMRKASEKDASDSLFTFMNTPASACKEGQLIYNNATNSDAGDPVYDKSELSETGHPIPANAGKPITATSAVIQFWTKDDASRYVGFQGYNGDGGLPTTFKISPATTGKWRVLDQRIAPDVKTEAGTKQKCLGVTREIILAPTGATWNSKAFPEWTWRA